MDYRDFYFWVTKKYKFILKDKLFKDDYALDYSNVYDTWEQAIEKYLHYNK